MGTGPAPKVEKHRRRGQSLGNSGANIRLPKGGRKGRPPRWPLTVQSAQEKAIWRRLWRTPASSAWEELGWHDIVARYCQVLVETDPQTADMTSTEEDWHVTIARFNSVAKARNEARQLEDRLGLTPMAMARLRWVIADEEEEESKEAAPDVRQRLRAM